MVPLYKVTPDDDENDELVPLKLDSILLPTATSYRLKLPAGTSFLDEALDVLEQCIF
jgi:hypothetical protein